MKKILAIALVLMLAVGCFCLTGCGDNTFGGNYQEATAEEVQTFASEVSLAGGSNNVDLEAGYQLIVKANMPTANTNLDMDIKFAKDAQKGLMLQATMNGNMNGTSVNGMNMWVSEGISYVSFQGFKYKKYDDEITPIYSNLIESVQDFDLSALAQRAIEDVTIKLGMVREDNGTTKIKFEMPENPDIAGTIILVFDADYDLMAMKFDVEMNDVTMNLELKPWNGTVNLPGDLNTYIG